LQKLRDDLRGRSFALVAINPNHPDGLSMDELGYGTYGESFAEMTPYAREAGWDFPYLYDGELQQAARKYGCIGTPHVFVFDRDRRLRYAGRFDDSRFPDDATVKSHDARNAVEALLAGKPVTVPLTKPIGCGTKWREKKSKLAAYEAALTQLPVVVDRLDAAGLAELRRNPGNKYRLVNVWATWCAPCVEEFPVLVSLSRQFDLRDNFEFVTLSLDDPKQETHVRNFLQKQGAGVIDKRVKALLAEGRSTNHYLYTGTSQDDLVATFDPEWPGPLPYTVLIAPGGKVIWRHNGVIDAAETRAAIVGALTPYFEQPK
jgi:thiol-disulfide isomerase/thioredoxin